MNDLSPLSPKNLVTCHLYFVWENEVTSKKRKLKKIHLIVFKINNGSMRLINTMSFTPQRCHKPLIHKTVKKTKRN